VVVVDGGMVVVVDGGMVVVVVVGVVVVVVGPVVVVVLLAAAVTPVGAASAAIGQAALSSVAAIVHRMNRRAVTTDVSFPQLKVVACSGQPESGDASLVGRDEQGVCHDIGGDAAVGSPPELPFAQQQLQRAYMDCVNVSPGWMNA
jgi:hypothetical protein